MKPEQLLESYLGLAGWEIEKPPAGLSKVSFIARCADKVVFLKLDVGPSYLYRLSQLGITPPVLANGVNDGTPFVIQEYSPGDHPTASWFKNHLGAVADLVNKYHRDETLARLLRVDGRISTANSQVTKLGEEIRTLRDLPRKTVVSAIFGNLEKQLDEIVTDELTPVHADPNKKNFLVDGATIQLIDWDEIVLSDPLRDSALICYWYLPEKQWQEFLEKSGVGYTEKTVSRLYWWAAVRSLEICLWFGARGQNHEMADYLEDSTAAIERGSNPHAHF